MRYASVCSGVEAASLAWMPLGWKAAWFSEIEPFPCAVLSERFPNVPNLGDMTKISITETGDIHYGAASAIPNDGRAIDLIVGGTPCQDASVAGKRAGLVDGERSKLAFTFTRLAYELAAYRGLRWVVWENVPGVFSLNGGRDFAAFLSSLAGRDVAPPAGGWGGFGICREGSRGNFGLCWRVLDVQYCRVDGFPRAIPQRRRRVFLVGYIGDWRRAAEVLFEPSSLCGDNPPKRSKRQEAAADAGGCVEKADGCLNPHDTQTSRIFGKDGSFHSINANSGGGMMRDGVLMTNSNGDGKTANTITGDHAGRVTDFTPLCVQQNQIGEVRTSPVGATLNTNSNASGRNAPLVAVVGVDGYNQSITGDVSKTISSAASDFHHVPDVMCVHGSQDPISNTEHANAVNRNNGLENCVCQYGESAGTLTERYDSSPCPDRGQNVVAQYGISLDGRRELQPQEELSHTECVGTNPGYKIGTLNRLHVRRLLPIECERLMGMPDNWTQIPWRGKPAEECPDAPRYKACGNSMGVNCMRWIGLGIEAVENGIRQRQAKRSNNERTEVYQRAVEIV